MTSTHYIIMVEQYVLRPQFNVIRWLCMKRTMDNLAPTHSTIYKIAIGSLMRVLMLTTSICSGIVYGYFLFPKMFEPTHDVENTEMYKLQYILTSTSASLIVMIFQEMINYAMQSKLDNRLEHIESDIDVFKEDVRVLKEDVGVLKEDLREFKINVYYNFNRLFDYLGIPPEPAVDLPLHKQKHNETVIEPLIDTRSEFKSINEKVVFGPSAQHNFKLEQSHVELRKRK